MIIRRATPGDAEQLIDLISKIYVKPSYDHYSNPEAWRNFVSQHPSYVCDNFSKIVASGALEDHGNHGVLVRSFVHRDYREKGIYKELFDIRIREAHSRKHEYVESHAATHHTIVQSFLLKRGFLPIGLNIFSVNDIAGTGQRGSLVLMRKPISDNSVISENLPDLKAGYVPSNYDRELGWQYAQIPSDFNPSLIEIHPDISAKLNLPYHRAELNRLIPKDK